MATLESLKKSLKQTVGSTALTQPLTDAQYHDGFRIMVEGAGRLIYKDFIIPQLSQLIDTNFISHDQISVLEIGPGPRSVLGLLPQSSRSKIKNYTAFEPNALFAEGLDQWLCSTQDRLLPFPSLENSPKVHRVSFVKSHPDVNMNHPAQDQERYDLILFCNSMYGMKPNQEFISRALELSTTSPNLEL